MEHMEVCTKVFRRRRGQPRTGIDVKVVGEAEEVIGIDPHSAELVYAMIHTPEVDKQTIRAVLVLVRGVDVVVIAAGDPVILTPALNLLVDKQSAVVETKVPSWIDVAAKRRPCQ